jgi:formylglycine-generating enzyme required for sulfatase activity
MKTITFILLFIANLLYAQTEKRLALLIGNNNYQNISILRSPYKDVDDMANALRNCGFEVMPIIKDGSKERIDKAVIEFSNKLKNYDVGMFYYSGHGAEVDGKNYIIPTDLPAGFSKEDIEYRCVNTDWLQNRMASSGAYNKTYIVVLDACRNNPFKSLSANKDILDANNWAPPTKIPSGTIVCYAASEGQTAADRGSTVNSPYTARFLKHMKVPNLAIESIFKRVRIELGAHEQKPQESTSLLTDFYFVKKDIPINSTTAPLPKDSDSDGISDAEDKCPNEYGTKENGGCAAPSFATFTERRGGLMMNMIAIPGGTYEMGCTAEQGGNCPSNEKPKHRESVSDFYMSETEVTQKQWRLVMGSDPEKLDNTGCDECPVEALSWEDAQDFINKLNEQTGRNIGTKYRLPTEVEWEYAARGGQTYKYAGSNNINEVAWYYGNCQKSKQGKKGTTHPVGTKKANGYGLYDMSGNVEEWCSDSYEGYPGSSGVPDYTGRGGSWNSYSCYCRVSHSLFESAFFDYGMGFRLALSK